MEHLQSALKINFSQFSDKGRKPENQDTVGARIPEASALAIKGIAIAIADGVSSSSSARMASQTAVTGFLTDYYATPDTWRTQQSAIRVIQSLNQSLWGQSRNSVREEGYLTTFSVLILKGDSSFIFHVGDTRVYRLRQSHLEQLTRDHTQRIDKKTTYLSRALGADPSLEIDMHMEKMEVGDIFVLTSDGIHDAFNHSELEKLIRDNHHDPDAIVKSAYETALTNHSRDNLSIQVARVESLGTPSQRDAVAVLSKLPFPPLLNAGHILDGMKVKRIMHESERSQVYLVETSDEVPLVMKTPSVNYEDDPAYIERFVMEAWIGSRIQNSNVVKVVPSPENRTALYYLTEYVAGPTLTQLIKERAPIAIPDAVELIEQLVKGVRAFHRKDTLHQDIKPENVVIGLQGPVIVDFGSCWVAGVQEMGSAIPRDHILGTLHYSAPEYRYGGTVGPRSDQFSLAVVLYEMLTKKLPYGEAFGEKMNLKAFQRLEYIPARKYNPLVPVWLDRALEKALNIQPGSRYDALSEWLVDIKRPNPDWLNHNEMPLLERDPVRVWQVIALIGWGLAILFMFL